MLTDQWWELGKRVDSRSKTLSHTFHELAPPGWLRRQSGTDIFQQLHIASKVAALWAESHVFGQEGTLGSSQLASG